MPNGKPKEELPNGAPWAHIRAVAYAGRRSPPPSGVASRVAPPPKPSRKSTPAVPAATRYSTHEGQAVHRSAPLADRRPSTSDLRCSARGSADTEVAIRRRPHGGG